MAELKVKTLLEFVDDMIQKYQITETENMKKTLRAKFFRELTNMHEWDKAKYRTYGRNRTKVFPYSVFEKLEQKCQSYLVKKSGYDLNKFNEYKKKLNDATPYEVMDEDIPISIQEESAFRAWAGSISKEEIQSVMLKALFEKFFTPIDVKQWQKDSDYLTIVDTDDDRQMDFEYYKTLERYTSYNKSAYYKEKTNIIKENR
ncbi:TPA: hypothetical protein U0K67_001446 [Streptococcus suis]|nr:hypothetical protein [Streptococcus suis]